MAELARAKEEERLVVLPCGVGSKVYIICRISKEIAEGKVLGLSILGERTCLITEVGTGNFSAIGRTIFLTREAAEAALQRSAT